MKEGSTRKRRNPNTSVKAKIEGPHKDIAPLRRALFESFAALIVNCADRVIDALEARNRELLTCLKYMDHVKAGSDCLKGICRPLGSEPSQTEIMKRAADMWDMAKTITNNVSSSLASLDQSADLFVSTYKRAVSIFGAEECWKMFHDLTTTRLESDPVYRGLWVEFLNVIHVKGIRTPLGMVFNGKDWNPTKL